MTKGTRTYRDIKITAKKIFTGNFKISILITLIVISVNVLVLFLQARFSAVTIFTVYSSQETQMANLFSLTADGIRLVFRFDLMGVVISSFMSGSQILIIILVQILALAVTAPVILASGEVFYGLAAATEPRLKGIVKWYGNLVYSGRAIGIKLVLGLITWGLRAVFIGIPLLAVWWINTFGNAVLGAQVSIILLRILLILLLAGFVFATAVAWTFAPANYILATDSEMSIRGAVARARVLMRGQMLRFFMFRLSFVIWIILVFLSSGLALLYVYPYMEAATATFIYDLSAGSNPDRLKAPTENE